MKPLIPCFLYQHSAEEAAEFYVSIIPNSGIDKISYYPEGTPRPAGSVLAVEFHLNGMNVLAINGPDEKFTPAISFQIDCEDDQEMIDRLWDRLVEGGEPSMCGWLIDKFGLSWQVTTSLLGKMLDDEDREKAARVMEAMVQMSKLDIAKLKAAYEGS